jgi:voltage-gated potassium channel
MAKRADSQPLLKRLRHLYEGSGADASRFRYGLLAFDVTIVAYIIATSVVPRTNVIRAVDVLFGLGILADVCARLAISDNRKREFLRVTTWTDVAAVVSFLAPIAGAAAGFLRIVRMLRLLRTYQMLARLRADVAFFRRHEDVVLAVVNLTVFVFVMTSIIHETQRFTNPQITSYVDALYFTVTSLTTTGYGDILLPGTFGRLLSVIVMVSGVTLFFGLARALLHPNRVRFRCPTCGLQRHDPDAVHCKACGALLNIPDEGRD